MFNKFIAFQKRIMDKKIPFFPPSPRVSRDLQKNNQFNRDCTCNNFNGAFNCIVFDSYLAPTYLKHVINFFY